MEPHLKEERTGSGFSNPKKEEMKRSRMGRSGEEGGGQKAGPEGVVRVGGKELMQGEG